MHVSLIGPLYGVHLYAENGIVIGHFLTFYKNKFSAQSFQTPRPYSAPSIPAPRNPYPRFRPLYPRFRPSTPDSAPLPPIPPSYPRTPAPCPPPQYEPRHKISNNVVCATSKALDQPAHMRSLIRAFARRLNILGVLSY